MVLILDSFVFTLTDAPDGMSVSDAGLITWTPLEGVLTSGMFSVTVSDGDLSYEQSFTITVEAVNDTPVIVSSATTEATEDIEYSYQVVVEDPDNDTFVFTLIDSPEGMSISDTGLITWTPLEGVLTSGLFTLTVFDGEFLISEDIQITVLPVNDSPVILSSAPTSIYLGDEYFYSILIEDPDNDEFELSIEGAPDGMILSDVGFISWTPESVGEYGPITITVSDGELSVSETFTLIVEYNYTVANYGLTDGNNLISFYSIPPEDQSVEFCV